MILVREKPPLRLHQTVEAPSGKRFHWGPDDPTVGDSPSGLTFSSTMPGGDEQCDSTLIRRMDRVYPDLDETAKVRVRGAGGEIAWGGRLEGSPRTSGPSLGVSPNAVGWQAHLDDETNARMIPVDIDQSHWQAASVQRKIDLIGGGMDCDDPSVVPDQTTSEPSVETGFTGSWARAHLCEGQYDAKGIPIGKIYYAWKRNPNVLNTDTNWDWRVIVSDDDRVTANDNSGNLRAAGPGSGWLTASTLGRLWGMVQLIYAAAAGGGIAEGTLYAIDWTCLAVYDQSGIPLYGAADQTHAQGVLASDVVAYALSRFTNKINYSTGPGGTIQPSAFVIPHLPFVDPTTVSDIIKQSTRFELLDWAVWDTMQGPTYFQNNRGERGRRWRARCNEAQLQDAGPQIGRLYNGAIVTFADVTGITRSVGPPGSGCNVESPLLADLDPQNPLNQAGETRYCPPIAMGTSTSNTAIEVGRRYLQEQKLISRAGQAVHVAYVEDEHGITCPTWMMKGGDEVAYVDASDSSYRRIIRTSYDESNKANSVSLDAPPDGLQQLLERLGVVLMREGLS